MLSWTSKLRDEAKGTEIHRINFRKVVLLLMEAPAVVPQARSGGSRPTLVSSSLYVVMKLLAARCQWPAKEKILCCVKKPCEEQTLTE